MFHRVDVIWQIVIFSKLCLVTRLDCPVLVVRQKTHTAQQNNHTRLHSWAVILEFLSRFNRQAAEVDLNFILNIDETPIYIDMPHTRTIVPTNSRSVSLVDTGHFKERFTVLLAIAATGICHNALVLIKGKTVPDCEMAYGDCHNE